MATCSSCGGSGYNAMSGVTPGSQANKPLCMTCNGSGSVPDQPSGGGNPDCFPGSALVFTSVGRKPIKDIKVGDSVLSIDPLKGLLAHRVFRTVKHSSHPVFDISMQGGRDGFSATGRHPVMTKRGWVRVSKLQPDDCVIKAHSDGTISNRRVLWLNDNANREPVYNLLVEETFNYVVDGYLAHSFVHMPHLRLMLNAIRSDVRHLLLPKTSAEWAAAI